MNTQYPYFMFSLKMFSQILCGVVRTKRMTTGMIVALTGDLYTLVSV